MEQLEWVAISVIRFNDRASHGILQFMTKLLEEAFSRASMLPEPEQDEIARKVLEELEADNKWDLLFSKAPEKLQKLADVVWAEHEAGTSEPLDPDWL